MPELHLNGNYSIQCGEYCHISGHVVTTKFNSYISIVPCPAEEGVGDEAGKIYLPVKKIHFIFATST